MPKLTEVRKSAYQLTEPLVPLLEKTHITPTTLTWLGFAISLGAAALIATGHLIIAGVVVLVSGLFDMLDGALARHTKQVTRSGAVLDSTLDRVSEAVLLLAVAVYYLLFFADPPFLGILFTSLALMGSPLVSYIRAKAEAIGLECKIGLFTRPERVVTLAVGLLASRVDFALVTVLAIIAVLSFVTAGQRLRYVLKQTRKQPPASG
jgi:CDP-diacylglycerol--glycerol-3-phosphate 3-phosphatidyltransferase